MSTEAKTETTAPTHAMTVEGLDDDGHAGLTALDTHLEMTGQYGSWCAEHGPSRGFFGATRRHNTCTA